MSITLKSEANRYQVEFDGLKFEMRPQTIKDRLDAFRLIREWGITDLQTGSVALVELVAVFCIESWDGIGFEDGKPAECNDENKLRLVSQHGHVVQKLIKEYDLELVSAEKNLESLPGGTKTKKERASAKTALDKQ
jgi:hypothetical protein